MDPCATCEHGASCRFPAHGDVGRLSRPGRRATESVGSRARPPLATDHPTCRTCVWSGADVLCRGLDQLGRQHHNPASRHGDRHRRYGGGHRSDGVLRWTEASSTQLRPRPGADAQASHLRPMAHGRRCTSTGRRRALGDRVTPRLACHAIAALRRRRHRRSGQTQWPVCCRRPDARTVAIPLSAE